ncbi:phosphate regulon sensor histidine kinase PhoR [bacterium]|nr:MAG: phosphate regulon sensor histidine kinase PhoR [bacterium]
MSPETRAWVFALGRIAIVLIVGVVVGLIVGHAWAGLALVLVLSNAWQLFNLFRLDYWLRDRSGRDAPDSSGIWGDVVTQVVRLHRRKRFHKQRLLTLFREIRHSTAAMPDGVVVLNAQGEIIWFNRMASRLLDLRRKADLGLRFANLIRQPEFLRYLEHGDFSEPLIVAPFSGNGLSLSFQVVPYGGNQQLILVRDVTHQVQLESLRKDFVANASHELRSPLTVISGYLETLEQDPAMDPVLQPPLQEMRRQAERMTQIVGDLLELSRLDAFEEEADGEAVDVLALSALLRKDVLARPRHPRIVLHMETDAQLRGDEPEIHSAFSNLVDNAAKYTPTEGEIQVRWFVLSTGEACFAVRDTGIGIPTEHLPRLTERFYRVDPGRSRQTGGSGLGLAIVKHVLQHHGARLAIDSTPGKGSTFTCVFPAHRVLPAAHAANIGGGRADTAAS